MIADFIRSLNTSQGAVSVGQSLFSSGTLNGNSFIKVGVEAVIEKDFRLNFVKPILNAT